MRGFSRCPRRSPRSGSRSDSIPHRVASIEYTQEIASRRDRFNLTWLSGRVASRGLPMLVGVILVLPLGMLLANSVNVAPAGQAFRYGLGNWQGGVGGAGGLGG